MDRIAARFAEHFSNAGITLPPEKVASRVAGHITQSGWLIQYCFGTDDKGDYLDYYASHRMSGDDHCRIYSDGSEMELPTLQGGFVSGNDPAEAKRVEKALFEANRKLASELILKGFTRFTLNMALTVDAVDVKSDESGD